jgi:signal transduction histidine kinase
VEWDALSKANLSEQILRVQEEERRRISRDLHDEVGHALMAISVSLEALRQATETGNAAVQAKFADARMLVQQTMETVHHFARELRPALLDDLGLVPALRSYARNFANRTGVEVDFRADAAVEALDSEGKTVIFRIAQESLTNVARHARAGRVKFSVLMVAETVCVEISDNGISFKDNLMECGRPRKRLGLVGMQERVGLVGGSFAIDSQRGKGTTVRAVIPFKGAGPARRCRSSQASPGFTAEFPNT